MKIDLSDKVALVTGGAKGIGREVCLSLAGAGAKVTINYSRSREEAETLRDEILQRNLEADTFGADISKHEDVEALFQHIRERSGRLDVLVNNAGIIRDSLLLAMELSDWDRVHDVNLRGAFLCTKKAGEMMMANHSGNIINIASTGAIIGGRGQTNYASSKGGLVSFTRACAVELGAKGIRINSILPGMIKTGMSTRVRKRAGEEILRRIPLGRFGEPADVANLVLFLSSDMADYITGQAIPVDGGLSVS
jgi:3-oxoacyl-[acyl-carrier protein] reductase